MTGYMSNGGGDRGRDRYHRDQRRRDHDRDREEYRQSRRSKSLEERSRSRSKSQRISGFDIAPPAAPTVPLPGISAPGYFPATLPVLATRQAWRVYVGGLPPTANELCVSAFFSHVMAAIGGNTAGPGDAVISVYINHDKKFAFVEMRSVEEASNAMALNGIVFEGAPVKVKRPSDYNLASAASLGPNETKPNPNLNLAALGLTGLVNGPDRIFIGGLPYSFTEAQIRELFEKNFGPISGFDLVKDRETGNSKCYAFRVFQDLSLTDLVCKSLNEMQLGNKTLRVNRANQATSPPTPDQETCKVVCLIGAIKPDDLKDDVQYEDIVEDMEVECGKYGTLVKAVIPRPSHSGGEISAGVGKVFLEYADIESASEAQRGLHGRVFAGNQVAAVFYPDDKFSQGDYNG